jgi:hypothetical protein
MSPQPSPAPGTPQSATKAQVALAVSAIGGILTFLISYFPDNHDVQVWGGLILGVLTVLGTTYGVYSASNKPLQ